MKEGNKVDKLSLLKAKECKVIDYHRNEIPCSAYFFDESVSKEADIRLLTKIIKWIDSESIEVVDMSYQVNVNHKPKLSILRGYNDSLGTRIVVFYYRV